jgi:hypothetical protein
MVVKMVLNAPRVAKTTYYNVGAKYERMLALYLVESIPTTGLCPLLTSITGIVFLL